MIALMTESISLLALVTATLVIFATLIVLMIFVAATRTTYPGFRHWTVALGLLSLAPAALLFFPPESPLHGWRLFVSWAPALAAGIVTHHGVRRFRRRPSTWKVDVCIAALGLITCVVVLLVGGSYKTLLLLMSVTMTVILLRAAAACVRGARPRLRPAYYLLGAALAWLAMASLIRGLLVLVGGDPSVSSERRTAEIIFFFGGAIGGIGAVIGAILALGQRQEVEMLDLQEVLRQQANSDFLTGLPNRRRFFELAHRSLKNESTAHTVVLFDVDQFKVVNDDFGHDLGDLVLKRVGAALAEALPASASIGRLGGDEFVAMRNEGSDEATSRAQDALVAVLSGVHRGILRRPVTLSAGVALVEGNGLDEALRLADRRLYAAKRAGGNRVIAEGEETGKPRESEIRAQER